jgi:hypothetical protein
MIFFDDASKKCQVSLFKIQNFGLVFKMTIFGALSTTTTTQNRCRRLIEAFSVLFGSWNFYKSQLERDMCAQSVIQYSGPLSPRYKINKIQGHRVIHKMLIFHSFDVTSC